jgi:hypothetical protein
VIDKFKVKINEMLLRFTTFGKILF